MDSHSKTYEQFCWVKQKNIIMEETFFHNGERKIICTNLSVCNNCGGCKNRSLLKLWEQCKSDDINSQNAQSDN